MAAPDCARGVNCAVKLLAARRGARPAISQRNSHRARSPEPPPINFTNFIDALSRNYGGFYRVLWRILSLEYGWIIAGLSENYGENYGEIIKILLLNYCSVAIILEHAGTGLELGTSWNPALGARNLTHDSLKKCPDRGSNP